MSTISNNNYLYSITSNEDNTTSLYKILLNTDESELVATYNYSLGPLGYNPQDNLLYSIDLTTGNLISLNENGKAEDYGPIDGLNDFADLTAGAMDEYGRFFLCKKDGSSFYVIDANPLSKLFKRFLDPTMRYQAITFPPYSILTGSTFNIADWSFVNGQLVFLDNPSDGSSGRKDLEKEDNKQELLKEATVRSLDPTSPQKTQTTYAKTAESEPILEAKTAYSLKSSSLYTGTSTVQKLSLSEERVTAKTISKTDLTEGKNGAADLSAAIAFSCSVEGYRVFVPEGATNSTFSKVNFVTGEITDVNTDMGVALNAIGYSVVDNLIYGMEINTTNLYAIDANGDTTLIGAVPNLPTGVNYNNGTVDLNGYYYIKTEAPSVYYTIDVNSVSKNFGQLIDPSTGDLKTAAPYSTSLSKSVRSSDWVYNVDQNAIIVASSDATVRKIDPATGNVSDLLTTGLPAGEFGSQYSFLGNYIYAVSNTTGTFYRIEVQPLIANAEEYFTQDMVPRRIDGTSCPQARLALDFGDAPDGGAKEKPGKNKYRTLLESDGPRHLVVDGLMLGTIITSEGDAYQSPDGLGDDQSGKVTVQDDGITPPVVPIPTHSTSTIPYTLNVNVTNTTKTSANLYGWIDLDQDGVFTEDDFASNTVNPDTKLQTIPLTFAIPANTLPGYTFIRLRLTSQELINTNAEEELGKRDRASKLEDTRSYGPAQDGEVEDYLVRVIKQDPVSFTCSPIGYRVSSPDNDTNSSLTRVNLVSGVTEEISPDIGVTANAIGYSSVDDVIYGIETLTNNLIAIYADGTSVNYGPVTNLPVGNYNTGTADTSGHLYVKLQGAGVYYTIDIDPASATFGQLLNPTAGFIPSTTFTIMSQSFASADWVYDNDDAVIYSVANTGEIFRLNPLNGNVIPITITGGPLPAGLYGSQYSLAGDYFYATLNSGEIYRIKISGSTATYELFSTEDASFNNDGTACPLGVLSIDFGDAPDTDVTTQSKNNYRTLLASNGPRHGIIPELYLGSTITGENDAYQSPEALGDDTLGKVSVPDDGAAILPLPPVMVDPNKDSIYTIDEIVFNNTGKTANLYGWIDLGMDGQFDISESAVAVVPSSTAPQTVSLNFTIPQGTAGGTTFARVRVTTDDLDQTLNPKKKELLRAADEDVRSYGPASDGEVEDYKVFVIAANVAFECSALGYRVAIPNDGTNSAFTSLNIATGESTVISPDVGDALNAIGYSVIDNLIYGIPTGTNELFVLDAVGNVTNYGVIPNLPQTVYNTGTADTSGHLYIKIGNQNFFYVVDIDPASATFGQLLDPTNSFALATAPYYTTITNVPAGPTGPTTGDWVYHEADGHLYAIYGDGIIYKIDPLTGAAEPMNMLSGNMPGGGYGATYSLAGDFMYAVNNDTGIVYRILLDGTDASWIAFAQDTPSGRNDGTSCPRGEILLDFGDAPDTDPTTQGTGNYRTLLASNGPRHILGSALYLGTAVTSEEDAYQSPDALGDDQIEGIQDDAVLSFAPMPINASTYSFDATVLNDTGAPANFYAWIDFNQDGIFQTEESFTTVVPPSLAPQTIPVSMTVPASALPMVPGETFARLRLTTDELTNTAPAAQEDERSFGPASDGEVEDYRIVVEDVSITSTKTADPEFANIGDTVTYTVTLENPGALPINDVGFFDTTPPGLIYDGNLMVIGAPYTGTDPITGLTFPTIEPGQIVMIKWDVIVDSIPEKNPTENIGAIRIPNLPAIDTPPATVTINNAELSPVLKVTDSQTTDIGETISYGIGFTNVGNQPADNVVITDLLPAGITLVDGSIVATAPYTLSSPDLTFTLNDPLAPGATFNIQFTVLVGEDAVSPIINSATIDFDFVVDPNGDPVSSSTETNPVETQINTANLGPVNKSVNSTSAVPGQTLTYTVSFQNTGTVDAVNVTVTDLLPAELTLVADSITSNVAYTAGSPDITLLVTDPVAQNDSVEITYQVLVGDNAGDVISNSASVDYTYFVDPNTPVTTTDTSEPVELPFVDLNANVVKSAQPENVVPGDTVTFTFTVENTGNTEIAPLILSDLLAPELEFVAGSVLIDDTPFPDQSPSVGITVPSVAVGQTLEVKFDAIVLEGDTSTIENTATADLFITIDGQTFTNAIPTDTITLGFSNPELTLTKTADPMDVHLNDVITYSVLVENTGDTPLVNIVFKDILSPCVEFVLGSFALNSSTVNNVNLEQGINIGSLNAGESALITYQAKVISGSCCGVIANSAFATYNYMLPDGTAGSGETTPVIAEITANIANFKQSSYNCHFTVPCKKPDMLEIDQVTAEITFNNHYVIDSPQTLSTENQSLSGKTLIAHGTVDAVLSYTADNCQQSQHSASFSFPISQTIILPADYQNGQSIQVSGIIESIHYEMLSEREGYVNFIVLILASTAQ